MKKAFKKITVLVLLFTLVFTFTVKPKKADAFVGEMTLAGIAATVGSSAMLPYALGAAGILAVGGVILNWDVAKDYGEKVIARMGGYDAASGSYVQNPDGTATVIYSPAMKLAMAQSVDDVPETVTAPVMFNAIGSGTTPYYGMSGTTAVYGSFVDVPTSIEMVSDIGKELYIDLAGAAFNPPYLTALMSLRSTNYNTDSASLSLNYQGIVNGKARYKAIIDTPYTGVTSFTLKSLYHIQVSNQEPYNLSPITASFGYAIGALTAGTTYNTADTFGTVADNVNARLLGMNAVIADNQAVTISADAELLNASIDDLANISDATLAETQTQTGILSQIWRAITSIPSSIAAAGVAASTAINAAAQDLWEDAGAVWSGMADTMTNIKTDINTKVGALQDVMSGGIDNIRADIGGMVTNLGAGIDAVGANIAGWGQLTLDGIEAGVTSITTGLTNTWTNVTAKITEGVGTITNAITTGIEYIAGMPAMLFSVFVPPASILLTH